MVYDSNRISELKVYFNTCVSHKIVSWGTVLSPSSRERVAAFCLTKRTDIAIFLTRAQEGFGTCFRFMNLCVQCLSLLNIDMKSTNPFHST